ncbi:hypothetical protein HK100_009772 [Physocladia obscura]|uniref:CBM21 domain-containing protein n=1 Tax=Physocladia obscura TaxID=109957 RepID=A0AAD5XEZ8_9FUNG|nr:hypothetical protein HK100_009772 [Physocladia obscura]
MASWISQENRTGSLASIASDSSDSSSSSNSNSSANDRQDSAPVSASDTDNFAYHSANQSPNRNLSFAGSETRTVRPILRSASSTQVRASASSTSISSQTTNATLKRLSFSSESLRLFNENDSPLAVSGEPHIAKTILPASPEPINSVLSNASNQELRPPQLEFSVLSASCRSPVSPANFSSKVPISFESVTVIQPPQSYVPTSWIKLRLDFLVQNLHFEKIVTVLYTTNAWKTHTVSNVAEYVSGFYADNVDRFRVEIDCYPSEETTIVENSLLKPDFILRVEFAVRCVMGGVEYWNNNDSKNHVIFVATRPIDIPYDEPLKFRTVSGTYKKTPSVLDLEAEFQAKRRASILALKAGHAIANEARRIDDEFMSERRKSAEIDEKVSNDRDESLESSDPNVLRVSPVEYIPSTVEISASTTETSAAGPTVATLPSALSIAALTPPQSPSIKDNSAEFVLMRLKTVTRVTTSRKLESVNLSRAAVNTKTTTTTTITLMPKRQSTAAFVDSGATQDVLESVANTRVSELSEKESEYVNILSRPNSPLKDVRAVKKSGSLGALLLRSESPKLQQKVPALSADT